MRSQDSDIYLIGKQISELKGSKLPSRKQTLALLFYNMRTNELKLRNGAYSVATDLIEFWLKSNIPTNGRDKVMHKVEALYNEWRKLGKNKTLGGPTHTANEKKFVDTLDDLFDIARSDALMTMTIEEDKQFLLAQRKKGRQGSMIGQDGSFSALQKRRMIRDEEEETRRKKANLEKSENEASKFT